MLRLNLLPWRERQRLSAVKRFKRALVGSMCLALCLVLLIDRMARQRVQQQALANDRRERAIAALDQQLEPFAQVRTTLEAASRQSQALASLRAGQQRLPALLSELEQALPDGVELTTLSLDGAQLHMTGLAVSAGAVAAFMKGLEDARGVSEPALRHMQRQAGGEHFRLAVQRARARRSPSTRGGTGQTTQQACPPTCRPGPSA